MMERLYLDSCVLNRPADDQSQERMRLETIAITAIFDLIQAGEAEWIASRALQAELSQTRDVIRRNDSLRLLSLATITVEPAMNDSARTLELVASGLGAFDALHLALAESAGATSLLTVDDQFIRRATQASIACRVKVENPVDWVRRRKPWLVKR